jgi:hypothetical protein
MLLEMSRGTGRSTSANTSRSGTVQAAGSVRAVPEGIDRAAVRARILAPPGTVRNGKAATVAGRRGGYPLEGGRGAGKRGGMLNGGAPVAERSVYGGIPPRLPASPLPCATQAGMPP